MRVAMLSYPRTGSTHLAMLLAKANNIRYLREPLTLINTKEEKQLELHQIMEQDDYVVKFMSHNFFNFGYEEVNWKKFDKIYVTHRENLTDGCISNYVALITNKWNRRLTDEKVELSDIEVPSVAIIEYADQIRLFNSIVQYIASQVGMNRLEFYEYANICKIEQDNGVFVPTELNYREILNYDEVEQTLRGLDI